MPRYEGRLPTKVEYIGLKDRQYDIRDTDRTSRDFFGIVEMPTVFTAGKNLFKIKAHPSNLVSKSPIYVEILDSTGNPIFYKPLRYIEKDGTRVTAVYINPDTAPGPCTIYLASRASFNPATGQPIPFSRDFQDNDYFEYPNVLWSTSVGVAPSARNDTEIIITKTPKITLSEVVQPYFQPVTIDGVLTRVSSSFTGGSVDSFGAQILENPITFPAAPTFDPVSLAGGNSARSPAPIAGDQFYDITETDDSLTATGNETTDAPPLYTLSGNNIIEVNSANDFRFTAGMIGGVVTIVNPRVNIEGAFNVKGITVDGIEYYLPQGKNKPTAFYPEDQFNASGTRPIFGTYKFAIVDVISGTKARIAQYAGFDNDSYNTFGAIAFSFDVFSGTAGEATITKKKVELTYNFTSSFVAPDEVVQTENFQSFADIILSDIEPETGDVFKVKTLYKPSGMFGDFVDMGDTILEEQQVLIDTGSFETNILVGTQYENYGQFEDLEEIYKYWRFEYIGKDNDASATNRQRVTASYDDTVIIGGARIQRQIDADDNDSYEGQFSYEQGHSSVFSIAKTYRPKLFKDTEYKIRGRVGIHSGSVTGVDASEDIRIQHPRLDIYVSGSNITSTGVTDIITLGSATLHPEFTNTLTEPVSGVRRTMPSNDGPPIDTNFDTNIYADNNYLGTRIGTVLMPAVVDNNTIFEFRFRPDATIEKANINFVIRSGEWTIGQLELVSHVETGFSPNFVRVGKRIPSTHLNTPLTFKFQLFDYRGNLADLSPVAYGAIFTGENQYINGTNNLITGSVTIGNAVGAGIELAGENSAYMRAISFRGYSASKVPEREDAAGGFMIYSGSVLPGENNYFTGQPYDGVGLELVDDTDDAHLIFQTAQAGRDSILDIKAKQFFIGNTDSQFISGANQNIEISSSIFHLDPDANDGAGGLIIGANAIINATLEANDIFVPAGSSDGGTNPKPTNANLAFISSSGLAKFAGNSSDQNYKVTFDPFGVSSIAGWTIGEEALANTNVHLSSSAGLKVFDNVDTDFVEMKYRASDNFGIVSKQAGATIFELGSSNRIAGWKFDTNKIISNNGVNSQANPGIVINSNGTIETDPFISGLTANATGWQIRSDGRAEFENAVIRGTLSTAVFEKDTVSVVGGQVMVANAAKLDKPEERFKDYPIVKSVYEEDVNYSGETLPATRSIQFVNLPPVSSLIDDKASIVLSTDTTISADNVLDSDIFFKIEDPSQIDMAFDFNSGSLKGETLRLTWYSSGSATTTQTYRLALATDASINRVLPIYTGPGTVNASQRTISYTSAGTQFHTAIFDIPSSPSTYNQVRFRLTTNTSDPVYIRDVHCMIASQSLTVDNAGGFVNGEILVAKSTDQGPDGREGFVREYMRVIDTDLGSSETPASGTFDFSSHTIDANTNLIVTASKFYTFTGTTTNQADVIANNQYYFTVGGSKAESISNIKSKINAEVQDMFVNTTGSAPGIVNQLYMQAVGQGTDGNSYGMQTGSTLLTLGGAIDRVKPTLTVERNLDARVEGNERGFFIAKMKDGQSMASQGSDGTGYILLNAQPTDTNTPYIDIVERSGTGLGSQQHTGDDADSVFGTVNTIVRVGDLSGITDNNFSDGVTGYGIYTTNGYFKGKIEVSSFPEQPNSANLKAHYPLDGFQKIDNGGYVAPDLINGAHASGSATEPTTIVSGSDAGPRGKALYVNNSSLNALKARSISGSLTSGADLAATFWAKLDNSTNAGGSIVTIGSDASNSTFLSVNFFAESGGNDLRITHQRSGGTGQSVTDYEIAGFNRYEWNFYTLILEHGSTPKLYVNAKQLSSNGEQSIETIDNTDLDTVEFLTIGGNPDGGSVFFDGQISDIKIWDVALTPDNIEAVYVGPDAQLRSTTIEGDRITTGKIRSNNWGASQGSKFDLDNGTLIIGGSDSPKLQFDEAGNLSITGVITATAGGSIGGWSIANTYLQGGSGTDTIRLQPSVGISMGASAFADAPFSVTKAGVLKAESGTIGGWNIETTDLRSTTTLPGSSNPTMFLRPTKLSNANRMLIGAGPRNDSFGEDDEGRVFNVTDTGAVTSSALLVQDLEGNKIVDTTNLRLDSGNSFRGQTIYGSVWNGVFPNSSDSGQSGVGDIPVPSITNDNYRDDTTYTSCFQKMATMPLGSSIVHPENSTTLFNAFIPGSDEYIVLIYYAALKDSTTAITLKWEFQSVANNELEHFDAEDIARFYDNGDFDAGLAQTGIFMPRLSVGQFAQDSLDVAGASFDANLGANPPRYPVHAPGIMVLDIDGARSIFEGDEMDFSDNFVNISCKARRDDIGDSLGTTGNPSSTPKPIILANMSLLTCGETQLQKIINTFDSSAIVTYYTGSTIPNIRNEFGIMSNGSGESGLP